MENELFEEARQTIDAFSKLIRQRRFPDRTELEDFAKFLRHPGFLENEEEREALINSCESMQRIYYNPKKEYRGKLSQDSNLLVGIKIVYDKLYLLRRYKSREKFRISWGFNSLGKLNLIDSFNLERKIPCHLLTSAPSAGESSQYGEDKAIISDIPDWMQDINYGFKYLPPEKKHESLARFGYALAHDLINHMDSGELVPQEPLPVGYLSLSELSSDAKAWHIIEKAAKYMPAIPFFDIKEKETTAQIVYEEA